jgi:hypothetical protein
MRAALCDILESFNYHPLCAANGEEALQLYDKFANEIKLVLSDVTMPGISGITLHEKLTAQNPDVKVILMSGYPMHETGLQTLGSGIVDWLKKPINMPQLAKAIAQALKTADQGKA